MQATNVEESVSATKADSTGLQVELEEAAGRRSAGEAPGSGSSARSWFKKQDQLRDPEYESLLEIVGKLVKTKLLERHQQELARLTSALNALRQQNDTSRWKAARLALSALETTEPNIEFVTGIRRDIEYYLQRTQQGLFRFVYVIAGTRPLGALMAGVLCTLVVLLVILGSSLLLMALGDTKADDVTRIDEMRWVVFPMVLFAALGSFVSIFVRLDQFADTESDDPFLTFCTGFFKPFIGIGFALFIYAVCRSDLIRINNFQLSSLSHHAFYAIGFLSGFSERFASDIITRAENRFVPPSAHSPVAATSASRPDQPHKPANGRT